MQTTLVHVPIDTITITERYRKDLGDLTALAASIQTQGLLHPIIVSSEQVLIVGRRRLAACQQLGWTEILARVLDFEDLLRPEHDENVLRKDFTPSEAVAIGEAIEAREHARLRQKQIEEGKQGGAKGGRGKKNPSGNFPEGLEERSRDIAGAAVGLSGKTYEKAKAVVHAAQTDPECGYLVADMDRTGNVTAAYRAIPRHLRPEPASPPRPRTRPPLSLNTMTLAFDRYMERILRDIAYLTEEEFQHFLRTMAHYTELLKRERKAYADEINH